MPRSFYLHGARCFAKHPRSEWAARGRGEGGRVGCSVYMNSRYSCQMDTLNTRGGDMGERERQTDREREREREIRERKVKGREKGEEEKARGRWV